MSFFHAYALATANRVKDKLQVLKALGYLLASPVPPAQKFFRFQDSDLAKAILIVGRHQ
jgi:hypothetical protein